MEPATTPRSQSGNRRADTPFGSRRRLSGPAAGARGTDAGDELILALVRDHSARMLAVARRYSICSDDANDAWQRSLEILIRRAASLDPATAAAWLRTVVKHEALAIRQERSRHLAPEGVEPDAHTGSGDVEAETELGERLADAAEALHSLKPSEAEAFVLLAAGLSYREIGEAKGWTYTKVNRLLTEGRRAFRQRVTAIESGDECERWRPTLDRVMAGEAGSREIASLRPHIRRCPGCRSELRSRQPGTRVIGLLIPGFGLTSEIRHIPGSGLLGSARAWLADLALTVGLRAQGATEALSGGKVVAVAASAAAIAGGGAVAHGEIERVAAPSRLERVTTERGPDPAVGQVPPAAAQAAAPAPQVEVPSEAGQAGHEESRRERAATAEFDPMSSDAVPERPSAPPPGSTEGAPRASRREGPPPSAVQPDPGPARSATRSAMKASGEAEFGP